jgi:hypothetical protein
MKNRKHISHISCPLNLEARGFKNTRSLADRFTEINRAAS